MATSTRATTKRKRPDQKGTPVHVRLQADDLELLDLWTANNGGNMTRPEAMRRILKLVAMRMPK